MSRAVTSARTTFTLAGERYQQGLTSYLDVVDAQRAALQAERTEVQLNGQRAVSTILLCNGSGRWLGKSGQNGDRSKRMIEIVTSQLFS